MDQIKSKSLLKNQMIAIGNDWDLFIGIQLLFALYDFVMLHCTLISRHKSKIKRSVCIVVIIIFKYHYIKTN